MTEADSGPNDQGGESFWREHDKLIGLGVAGLMAAVGVVAAHNLRKTRQELDAPPDDDGEPLGSE